MANRQIWPEDVQAVENLHFEHVESKYIKVVIGRLILVYLILMVAASLILTADLEHGTAILVGAEAVLLTALAINVALSAKILNFKGYALRDHDITYRSGLFFTKVTTIPFEKIQQVTVRMNPLSRLFGLYYVDVINGTQDSSNQITIPGLTHQRARQIETLLIRNIDPPTPYFPDTPASSDSSDISDSSDNPHTSHTDE